MDDSDGWAMAADGRMIEAVRQRWRGVSLLGIVALELAIVALDNAVPQDVPTSHLYYVPIILAAGVYGYMGGALLAVVSLILFALANYVWNTPRSPHLFLPAAVLTFAYYLAVGIAAAAFFGRQRQIRELGSRLRARVEQLDALNRVALIVAASDTLDLTLRTILSGVRTLGVTSHAGIIPLPEGPDEWTALAALRDPEGGQVDDAPLVPELLRRVATEAQPLLIEDGATSPLTLPAPWRAFLALPLVVGGEVVGVLYAADVRPRTFTDSDRGPLETLAQQAAEAIARARLRARELDLAVSHERNRLAREIHDTLAQSLLALVLQLEAAAKMLPTDPGRAGDELRRASATARAALTEARRSVQGLRPIALERGTLTEVLASEVAACGDEIGIVTHFEVAGEIVPLPALIEDGLYGVAREALNNVRKHARARSLIATLAFASDAVTLTVSDDGAGFDPATSPGDRSGRFGLVGMRERVRLLGGDFVATAAPGQGTRISATVPLRGRMPGFATQPVRVLVCDDHTLVRRGVAEALLADVTLAVVGEAGSGAEALARAALVQPDLVLLDLRLPDIDGVEVTRRLLAAQPALPILILTSFSDDPALLDALRAGARGCLLKDVEPTTLVAAIHSAVRGEPVLASVVTERLLADWRSPSVATRQPDALLSPRERDVLKLVAQGARNKEIAHALGITERTAKAHLSHIMEKLDAVDRTAAVTIAVRRGLIEP